MNGRPFVLIGVDSGDDAETLRDAAHREEISWPVVFDRDCGIAKAWGATSLPTVFVLDARRAVRAFNPSTREMFSTVDALLATTE